MMAGLLTRSVPASRAGADFDEAVRAGGMA